MSLDLTDISFSYGSRQVLNDITTVFPRGATALLGPNGAGKSTLLELLASVRVADHGEVQLDGVGPLQRRAAPLRRYRRAVAWLPQSVTVYPGLKLREHVAYEGWLKGMDRRSAWREAEAALDVVGLLPKAGELANRLSGGQRRRLGIAGALVHQAQVVLLDEPTAGLDPAQRKTFRTVLERIAADRVVVVSSHDTDDAHSAFDRAVVLREGSIVFEGTMDQFVAETPADDDMRDRIERAYIALVQEEI
jgi:ABC-type multidrug transport system ATPase subunit